MTATADGFELRLRLEAAQAEVNRNLTNLEDLRSRLTATRSSVDDARGTRDHTRENAFSNLLARLESLPIIEQAKGVIMAQSGGDSDHAFEVLRRASMRSNVKVRDLAAQIVSRASHGNAPPASKPRVSRLLGAAPPSSVNHPG